MLYDKKFTLCLAADGLFMFCLERSDPKVEMLLKRSAPQVTLKA
jgi:hypothetical protein